MNDSPYTPPATRPPRHDGDTLLQKIILSVIFSVSWAIVQDVVTPDSQTRYLISRMLGAPRRYRVEPGCFPGVYRVTPDW